MGRVVDTKMFRYTGFLNYGKGPNQKGNLRLYNLEDKDTNLSLLFFV